MANQSAIDQLIVEIKPELHRYDKFINDVINEKELRDRFVNEPASLLAERGLTRDANKEDISTANKLLLQIVTSKKVRKWMRENADKMIFSKEEIDALSKKIKDKEISIRQIDDETKIQMIKLVLFKEDFIRGFVRVLLEETSIVKLLPACWSRDSERGSPEDRIISALKTAKNSEELRTLSLAERGEDQFCTPIFCVFAIAVVVETVAIAHAYAAIAQVAAAASAAYTWIAVSTSMYTSGKTIEREEEIAVRSEDISFIVNAIRLSDALETAINSMDRSA